MQGFVQNYFQQQQDVAHSQKIMYYFSADKLPVLTSLATNFAVFNRWFASIPGPTILQPRLCALWHLVRTGRHEYVLSAGQEHIRTVAGRWYLS